MRNLLEALVAVAIVIVGGSTAVVLTGEMPEAIAAPARQVVGALGIDRLIASGEAAAEQGEGSKGGRGGRGETVVTTAAVRVEPFVDRIQAIGTARATQSVTVATSVAGRIAEIHFRSNSLVEANQPLVTLERDAEAIAVERAKAQYAQAEAANSRYQQAGRGGTFSTAQIEEVSTTLAVAEAALREAEFEYDRRVIRAPFGGRVGLNDLAVGAYLGAGDPVVTLDDTNELEVEFLVPEGKAGYAEPGAPVRAMSPAMPGRAFTGEIAAVDSRIDPQTRTMRVRALVPNPDHLLKPGMTFSMTMPIEGETMAVVPALAVQWSRDGASVWRVGADGVARVPVVIRKRDGDDVYIDADLAPDDVVAVEGAQKLNENSTIAGGGAPAAGPLEVRFEPQASTASAAGTTQATQ